MLDEKKVIERFLSRSWVKFGFNCVPIYLNLTGESGFKMKKILGYGYNSFIYFYKNKYGEMDYETEDLSKIWKIINCNLSKDKKYLIKIKKEYETIFKKHKKFFSTINWGKINDISDKNLVKIFNRCCIAQIDSGGLAHILDAISIEGEKELRNQLIKVISNQENFNQYFSTLIMPSKPAFVTQQERDLLKISKSSKKNQINLLTKHFNKYFWFQNSYVGPKKLTVKSFENALFDIKNKKFFHSQSKQKIIKKLGLKADTKDLLKLIDYCMVWQDERKANILYGISHLYIVSQELCKRAGVNYKNFIYISAREALNIKSISDVKEIEKKLKSRSKGVYFLTEEKTELVLSGSKSVDFLKKYKKAFKVKQVDKNKIFGNVANNGTAVGEVKVCLKISDIYKVKIGDILVASMTRPEFLPAIKKAAAIVTDEGGITSHAAIVARELNIPAIIGTKIGTRVLKDGMRVKVLAGKGLVEIIKK